ncbi:MAG: TRAP transporter substrate-binding protein [Deltaproteobacteria bacterium]|nr:TRAP transporter substrate-binding protein [Deltaproteobacteria bacterium]
METKKLGFAGVVFALLLGLALSLPRNVEAQGTITLKYANFAPAATFPGVQMERWAKEVEKRTNGKVKVQTFPGGTLLSARNMFEGVISGLADIGNFAMSYQPGRFPLSEVIDLPLGFSSSEAASLALLDLVDKYDPKEFKDVKVLTVFAAAPFHIITKTPVKSIKDLKGMELRVAGTTAEVLEKLGGIPVAMPQTDTPEALQRGVVKGMITALEVLKDFNYAAYCPHVTMGSLGTVTFAVVMNKEKWSALPDDVKKILDGLRREQAQWTGKYEDDHCDEAVAWAKQKYKLQIHELPAAEKAEISKLLNPMMGAYVKKVNALGLPGDQILKDAYSLKAKYDKGQ